MTEYQTSSGKILTDEDIQALADEAEQGYDVEPGTGVFCTCPRRDDKTIVQRLSDCPIHGGRGEL